MSKYDDDDEASRAVEQAIIAGRLSEQQSLLDLRAKRAIERGQQPDTEQDPEWWAEQLAEHERSAVLPPSFLLLLKEDAGLDDELDRYATEAEVRERVEAFNGRVLSAREDLPEDTPPIAKTRDVDAAVEAWQERYSEFRTVPQTEPAAPPPKRHWWNLPNRS